MAKMLLLLIMLSGFLAVRAAGAVWKNEKTSAEILPKRPSFFNRSFYAPFSVDAEPAAQSFFSGPSSFRNETLFGSGSSLPARRAIVLQTSFNGRRNRADFQNEHFHLHPYHNFW